MTQLLAPLIKPLAGAWARRRVQRRPATTPHDTLRDLLTRARDTRFGKEYQFTDLLQQADLFTAFQQRLPVQDYETWVAWLGDDSPLAARGVVPLENQAWPGRVDMFCLSSGTTSGRTKYVPYSAEMASINRKAAIDFFAHLLAEEPGQAPLLSQTLYMAGSTNLARDEKGVLAGDMSALTKYLAPRLLDGLTQPPPEIASLEPWERRLEALVDICCSGKPIGTISGIPIWQLTLLEAVTKRSGRSIAETMPHLRFLIHGGMSIAPYRSKIETLAGPQVTPIEVYAASEIGIGAYQVPGEQGMRFQHHYGVFYEFEDDDGILHGCDDLEAKKPYRLVVSSCSGLWRYRIGDVLIFSSVKPLTLDRVGRDKTTSAFDEKVTEQELQQAMQAVDPSFADFSLGPDINQRRHVWFVMGEKKPEPAWLEKLDSALRGENQDYDDYRGDGRINPPQMVMVPQRGTFLEAIGRAEGGQRKFPRLLSPQEVQTLLDTFG